VLPLTPAPPPAIATALMAPATGVTGVTWLDVLFVVPLPRASPAPQHITPPPPTSAHVA
jgi:hypothetical protein